MTKVQSLKQEYRQFLKDHFKGLQLREPLFYHWNIGLRFDLQSGKVNNSTRIVVNSDGQEANEKVQIGTNEYFDELIRRSTTIFAELFESSDTVLLVYMDYKFRHRRIRNSNFVFKQIEQLNKTEIKFTIEQPDDRSGMKNTALLKCITNRIKFKEILNAIGNTDFLERQPRLDNKGFFSGKKIYFININKKLILHMYDDRGLDVIAAERVTLRPIYKKYNSWILDYDRNKINEAFEEKNLI